MTLWKAIGQKVILESIPNYWRTRKMILEKSNAKKSISSRIDKSTYDKLVKVSKVKGHRFFDRKVAYMVNKILEDWADKE